MTFGPAEKMRIARRLAARALGVDELPDDADVEVSLDAAGNLRVVCRVVARGGVPHVSCAVAFAGREGDPPTGDQ